MSPVAQDAEKLRELDDDVRRAWAHYSECLRDLHGEEYEQVEARCWQELQDELDRLARSRRRLSLAIS